MVNNVGVLTFVSTFPMGKLPNVFHHGGRAETKFKRILERGKIGAGKYATLNISNFQKWASGCGGAENCSHT